MGRWSVVLASAAVALAVAVLIPDFGFAAGAASAPTATSPAAPQKTLKAFASEHDLQQYLKKLRKPAVVAGAYPDAAPPPPAMAEAGNSLEGVTVTGARAENSITNNQVANVDEGDIVKARGDLLVILRRGRLFTVSIAGGGMKPVDSINAYPPGVNAGGDWYDEMLISNDHVVVIGYSYSRGGTQINRFHLDGAGHLRYEDAYQLRSNDYYSSRNYASRLIGTRLVLYSPRYLPWGHEDPVVALPALRRWTAEGNKGRFERIGTAREVYLSPGLPTDQIQAVHTVTSCDLTAALLACKATSVFGPDGRVFYVSSNAVYVWLTPWWRDEGRRPSSIVYRLPLDGKPPTAIAARGAPVDQFSFQEETGTLDVLVRADSAGDAMWAAEHAAGAVALARIPLDAFGDGTSEVPKADYHGLPTPKGSSYAFHNRFVGAYILYGEGNGWGTPQDGEGKLIVAAVRGGQVSELTLPHGIDRIELMGRDAVVVGGDSKNVFFSEILLKRGVGLGDRYKLADAAQSETRSHGFFFKPERDDDGVIGLPVSRPARPAYRQLFEDAASIVFIRRADSKFAPLGELGSHPEIAVDDACVASCVDWYGNARPIFKGARAFALMGYELVEGKLSDKAITELARVNFAPARAVRTN
jgi:hypothetical protein